tara:strand:- start:14438 stop:15100 length:663 start_codon:yes stop_codon:yes gene_type:complete
MNLLNKILIMGLVISVSACSANPPAPLVDTPEIEYKTKQVEYTIDKVPHWYITLPTDKTAVFSTGASTAPDLQLAIDIAVLNAKVVLADRINGKLNSMTKSFVAKIGQDEINTAVLTEIEQVTKNIVASVDVSGYSVDQIKLVPSGTQYRAFVLLKYSDKEAMKMIMHKLRKDRMIYSKIRSTNAWKELEVEVEKSKAEDEAKSLINIEELINKNKNEPR